MAEDQNNDEYRFVELDTPEDETPIPEESTGGSIVETTHFGAQKNVKRNALIAIAMVVLIMFLYKIVSYMRSEKEATTQSSVTPLNPLVTTPAPIQPQPVVTQPQPSQQLITPTATLELTRKVATIELSQQSIQTEVGNVSQQVGAINDNVNNLNNQLVNLQQVINNLSAQLAKQSDEVAVLMERTKPKKRIAPVARIVTIPITYSIQAIIPGRAWLIATNGSTITVREGTKISGYGVVNLIDALDGRVVTSSGKVIRFSQEDS